MSTSRFIGRVASGVLVFLAVAAVAYGHHSAAAEFDINQPVTVKGKITKMDWVNPHAWLYVDVTDPDGKVVNWAFELGSPNSMVRRGWRLTDLPLGAEVTIQGHKARPGVFSVPTATTRSIKLPDGKELFAGR